MHYLAVEVKFVSAARGLIIVQPLVARNTNTGAVSAITPKNPTSPNLHIRIRDFNHPDFIYYPDTETALNREISSANNTTVDPNTNNPTVDPNAMNPEIFYGPNNPILKAFNSTAGKGLAGVITSFKVDYKESDKRWGTDVGTTLRAPMYVTISVTMAVIHDIPLGLDANGIMNAPIWPVGHSSNYFMRNERPQPTRAPPGPNTVASSPQAVDSEVAGAPRGLG